MILLPAPPRAGRNVYHLSFSAAAWELQLSRLEAGASPDKEVMQASASTAEAGCLGTPCPLPRGRIDCENKPTDLYRRSWGVDPHQLRAQVCFVSEWPKRVWFAISLGLKSEQSPVDLLVSVTDRIIQRPLPHWRICKVSLQLPGLKRLRDLIIFGTSLSQIQWKSANRLWNYGKVEWTNIELQKALESRLKMRLKPGSWVCHSCHPHVIYLWAWMDGTQDPYSSDVVTAGSDYLWNLGSACVLKDENIHKCQNKKKAYTKEASRGRALPLHSHPRCH